VKWFAYSKSATSNLVKLAHNFEITFTSLQSENLWTCVIIKL